VGVTITYTSACGCVPLAAGSVAASASAACSTTVVTLSASGFTSAGTSLRWQASYDSVNWTDLPVTTSSYIFTGLGVTTYYRVKVTCFVNGDTVFSAGKRIQWFLCPPTSVKEAAAIDLQIYPNPVKEQLTVVAPRGGYTNLVIINSVGQEVLRQRIDGEQTVIDVALLPAGVYQMLIRGERASDVIKILKQ